MEPSLTRVTRNVSPTRPRRTGPGAVPPKVHRVWRTPGATSTSVSVTTRRTRWVRLVDAGARRASYALNPGPGSAMRSGLGWSAGSSSPPLSVCSVSPECSPEVPSPAVVSLTPIDLDGQDHAHLAVTGDGAPPGQATAHDGDLQRRGLPRGEPRRALTGLQDEVVHVVAAVDHGDCSEFPAGTWSVSGVKRIPWMVTVTRVTSPVAATPAEAGSAVAAAPPRAAGSRPPRRPRRAG